MPDSPNTASFSYQLTLKDTKFKQITDSNHVSQNSLDICNTRASGMYFITCSKPCTYLIQYVVKRKSTGAINLASGDKSIS